MFFLIYAPLCFAHLRRDESHSKAEIHAGTSGPAFESTASATETKRSANPYLPLSSGSKRLCNSSWNQGNFDSGDIVKSEFAIQTWMQKLPTTLESFSAKVHSKFADGRSYTNRSKDYWSEYWKILPPVGPACKNLKRFGPAHDHDQSKQVCGSGSIQSAAEDGNECLVVSLGSNNKWDFEEAVFDTLPCRILTFDCTSKDTMPDRIRSRTTFYNFCVDREDRLGEKRHKYMTWQTLMKNANIRRRPDILKIDIEGYEYSVLPAILAVPQSLQPHQILMEMHADDAWTGKKLKTAGEMVGFVRNIYDAGYRFTYVDKWTFCAHCREVVAVKIYCG